MRFRNRYNPDKLKPKREFSTGYLEDELDTLTSKIVRRLEPLCFTCGISAERTPERYLQCGHLFERRHRPTRWDISPTGNNHAQCARCNADHEGNFSKYQDAFISRFGERAFHELGERAHANTKMTYSDLVELLESHKATWRELRAAA